MLHPSALHVAHEAVACVLLVACSSSTHFSSHLVLIFTCRGSVVRYIQLPRGEVDVELLQDATRKENAPKKTEKKAEKAK